MIAAGPSKPSATVSPEVSLEAFLFPDRGRRVSVDRHGRSLKLGLPSYPWHCSPCPPAALAGVRRLSFSPGGVQ